MPLTAKILVPSLFLLLISQPALQAQPLTIPRQASPASAGEVVAVPTNGMSMERVESEFGAPLRRSEPVGRPPIRVWHYAEYRVYFEYETVLHTVRDGDIEMKSAAEAVIQSTEQAAGQTAEQ